MQMEMIMTEEPMSRTEKDKLIKSLLESGYVTLDTVCEYLGKPGKPIHRLNVQRWIRERSFPVQTVSKNKLFFLLTEVDAWISTDLKPKIGRPKKPIDPNAPEKIKHEKKGRPFKEPGTPKAPYKSKNPNKFVEPILDKPAKRTNSVWNLLQVCEYLGKPGKPISEKTIRRWIKTRNFPAHTVTRTNLRFVKAEIDAWTLTL